MAQVAPRRVSLEALVLAYLVAKNGRGARLGELEALVEAAARAGVLVLPPGKTPRQGLLDYLAYLRRIRSIEVEGDVVRLVDGRVSPMLRRVLEKVQEEVIRKLEPLLVAHPADPLPGPLRPKRLDVTSHGHLLGRD